MFSIRNIRRQITILNSDGSPYFPGDRPRGSEPYFEFVLARRSEDTYQVTFDRARELFGLGGTPNDKLVDIVEYLLSNPEERAVMVTRIAESLPRSTSDSPGVLDRVNSPEGRLAIW